ncbi:MAG: nucleoside-diphosphate sugar epimerase [Gammaproteobacteria bacterium]|nr:MAG: nucleoside-diphosphate sugar epimerase [Gammaproteobacteria bacterium]
MLSPARSAPVGFPPPHLAAAGAGGAGALSLLQRRVHPGPGLNGNGLGRLDRTAHNSGTLSIWRLSDGKAGHDQQSLGLARALGRLRPASLHHLPLPGRGRQLAWLLAGRFPPGRGLPDPDLILGAGHGTHLALLAARRARGGRAIVLMRPSLPAALFDLCLVPEHDGVTGSERLLTTRGPLNPMEPSQDHRPDRGLILVGGPSRHYGWDEEGLLGQVRTLLERQPEMAWTLADSRRTPDTTRERLATLAGGEVRFQSHRDCPPGWLASELAVAGQVWVSEDSASMLYEALTAGAATGLLQAPPKGPSRVRSGVDSLLQQGLVTPFAEWLAGARPEPPGHPFDEAGRVAGAILRRWFPVDAA